MDSKINALNGNKVEEVKEKETSANVKPEEEKTLVEKKKEANLQQNGPLDISKLSFEYDRYFLQWLKKNQVGILICAYKSNSVFSLGTVPHNENHQDMLSFWITNMLRPMGSTYNAKSKKLYVGGALQLWQFFNEGQSKTDREILPDFDAHFVPRTTHIINDIDCHDITLDKDGKIYFCSALFCCICTVSEEGSFKVFWRPPWVSKTAAEDRCHLNGLCTYNGVPRFVTCVAQTDIRGGWRKQRVNGGVVYDIVNDQVICKGLSMPHSPRVFRDQLWLLDSGTGYFGYVDFEQIETDEEGNNTFKFVRKVFMPGFLRGLQFVNDRYAVIGSSLDRHEQTFMGLPLSENMKEKGADPKCGIFVVDMESLDVVHQFEFKGGKDEDGNEFSPEVKEIYDICVIPNCRRPRVGELDMHLATEYKVVE